MTNILLKLPILLFFLFGPEIAHSQHKASLSGKWRTPEIGNGLVLILDIHSCRAGWCATLDGLAKGKLPGSLIGKRAKVRLIPTIKDGFFIGRITAIDDKRTYVGTARLSKDGSKLFLNGCTRTGPKKCRKETWTRYSIPIS